MSYFFLLVFFFFQLLIIVRYSDYCFRYCSKSIWLVSLYLLGMPDERILLIAGLPSKLQHEQLYQFFGAFGPIQQIRVGCSSLTKGYCIVVYELCDSARNAMAELNDYLMPKGRRLKVAVYDDRDKKALERRKRKREVQAEYKKHVAASGVEKEGE